jgi:hypothetical protein
MVAHRKQSALLRGPSGVDMGVRVPETLQAVVAVRLSTLEGGEARTLFEGSGRNAGLEIAGDLARLLKHRRKGDK